MFAGSGCATTQNKAKWDAAAKSKMQSVLSTILINYMEEGKKLTDKQKIAIKLSFSKTFNKTDEKYGHTKDFDQRVKCDALCHIEGTFLENGEYMPLLAEYNKKTNECNCGGVFSMQMNSDYKADDMKKSCDILCKEAGENFVADYDAVVKYKQCKCIEKQNSK